MIDREPLNGRQHCAHAPDGNLGFKCELLHTGRPLKLRYPSVMSERAIWGSTMRMRVGNYLADKRSVGFAAVAVALQ